MKNEISLKSITKIYDGMQDVKALDQVELTFTQGEFVSIIGKSGSGKSTMLNMLTGIDRPTSGDVQFNKESLCGLNEMQLTRWRGRNIGIVFQFFQLMPSLTVLENVMLPMDVNHTYPKKERRKIAEELLAQVEISECANKLPSEISGGQQQRAAIARALANHPPFLIADEPTGNLDSVTSDKMIDLFRKLADSGTAVIMVTHNNDVAKRADRIITIRDGKIVTNTLTQENIEQKKEAAYE